METIGRYFCLRPMLIVIKNAQGQFLITMPSSWPVCISIIHIHYNFL